MWKKRWWQKKPDVVAKKELLVQMNMKKAVSSDGTVPYGNWIEGVTDAPIIPPEARVIEERIEIPSEMVVFFGDNSLTIAEFLVNVWEFSVKKRQKEILDNLIKKLLEENNNV